MKLKCMTWNVTGLTTAIPFLLQELKGKHITVCGLSEHWLLQHNQHILANLSASYSTPVVSCNTPTMFQGRLYGRGGIALMWHNSINQAVQLIDSHSDRIAAIKRTLRTLAIYVVQVYLPCTSEPLVQIRNRQPTRYSLKNRL